MSDELKNTHIFSTQNRQLAVALMTAGCEIHSSPSEGPVMNLYTVGKLRDIGLGGQGLSIESAAKLAVKQHIPGHVTYFFVRDDALEKAIKAWDLAVQMLEAKADLPDVSVENIMIVCCLQANNHKSAKELVWARPALVTDATGSQSNVDHKMTVSGKGRVWSLGCSQSVRDHLKLPKA